MDVDHVVQLSDLALARADVDGTMISPEMFSGPAAEDDVSSASTGVACTRQVLDPIHALDWSPERQLKRKRSHFKNELTCLLARSDDWIMSRDDNGSILLESATS